MGDERWMKVRRGGEDLRIPTIYQPMGMRHQLPTSIEHGKHRLTLLSDHRRASSQGSFRPYQ